MRRRKATIGIMGALALLSALVLLVAPVAEVSAQAPSGRVVCVDADGEPISINASSELLVTTTGSGPAGQLTVIVEDSAGDELGIDASGRATIKLQDSNGDELGIDSLGRATTKRTQLQTFSYSRAISTAGAGNVVTITPGSGEQVKIVSVYACFSSTATLSVYRATAASGGSAYTPAAYDGGTFNGTVRSADTSVTTSGSALFTIASPSTVSGAAGCQTMIFGQDVSGGAAQMPAATGGTDLIAVQADKATAGSMTIVFIED